MSAFLRVLKDFPGPLTSARHRAWLAQPTACELAAERIDAQAEATRPTGESLQSFRERVLAEIRQSGMERLSAKDFKRLPEVFWSGSPPLLAIPGVGEMYAARFRQDIRMSQARTLARCFFDGFVVNAPEQDIPATLLREAASVLPRWKWSQPARQFDLFHNKDVSEALLGELLGNPAQPAMDTLTRIGFRQGLERSNYVQRLFRATCKRADVSQPAVEDWLWNFAWTGESLRFASGKNAFADALLKPWLSGAVWQTPERRDQVLSRVVRAISDPRLRPAAWSGVREDLVALVRQWLNKASIELFLEIIDRVARDDHWRYRRAFWMSYFDRGWISDAWVVFGKVAHAKAGHLRKAAGADVSGFGRLDGSGEGGHSVLLMRLGDLVIAEFSHNGKAHFWSGPDAARAPRLYQSAYEARALKYSGQSFIHFSSDTYGWQTKVAEYIKVNTSLYPDTRKWKP